MLLKDSIKALGKEFGLAEVTKEAVGQYEVEKIQVLVRVLPFNPDQRKARIKAARTLFGWEFKQAKEWIEAQFGVGGYGDPI